MDEDNPKIFISHAWEDNEISRKLAEYLKRDGAEIWIDTSRISGGDSLPEVIGEGIEWCDIFILIWSKSAKSSYYVKLEWNCAIDNQKRIIPCLIDDEKLPTILSPFLHLGFENFDKGYYELALTLKLKIKEHEHDNVSKEKIEPSENVFKKHIINTVERSFYNANSHKTIDKKDVSQKNITNLKPIIIPTKFRNSAKELSTKEIISLLKKYNFFDSNLNENGRGFASKYEIQNLKNNIKVVIDQASSLMWQRSGSLKQLNYKKAKEWIEELNRKGYAGFYDWRLPTLEEAMSLMEAEPKKQEGKYNYWYYVDPIFNKKQYIIWTSDLLKGQNQTLSVWFPFGCCTSQEFDNSNYVRAVRSLYVTD
jgi:hypothetical protein